MLISWHKKYLLSIYFPIQYALLSTEKTTWHTKGRNKIVWEDKAILKTRLGHMLGFSARECKITMINMLKDQMEKVNNMQTQIILVQK